jgi:hypothetical protein
MAHRQHTLRLPDHALLKAGNTAFKDRWRRVRRKKLEDPEEFSVCYYDFFRSAKKKLNRSPLPPLYLWQGYTPLWTFSYCTIHLHTLLITSFISPSQYIYVHSITFVLSANWQISTHSSQRNLPTSNTSVKIKCLHSKCWISFLQQTNKEIKTYMGKHREKSVKISIASFRALCKVM